MDVIIGVIHVLFFIGEISLVCEAIRKWGGTKLVQKAFAGGLSLIVINSFYIYAGVAYPTHEHVLKIVGIAWSLLIALWGGFFLFRDYCAETGRSKRQRTDRYQNQGM